MILSPLDLRQCHAAFAASTALIVQFVLVSWTFPLSALLSEQPLFHIDGAYHWYQIHVAHDLGVQGRLTGYDPYFAAGHLGGAALNASAKVPALLAVVFGSLFPETQIYKLYVFSASVIAPSLVPIAAGLTGIGGRSTWIATALALCAWWASAFRWYHTAGMVSFVFACYLALPYVALLVRSMSASAYGAKQTLLLGALGAAGLFLHPLFPIPVAVAFSIHVLANWRGVSWGRGTLFLGAVAVLSLLPNLPWIVGMLSVDVPPVHQGQPYQRRVDITAIPKEMLGLWGDDSMGAKLYPGLVAASFFAAFAAADPRDRRFSRASLIAWAILAVFAAVGASVPAIGIVQPNRFSSAAYLFLVLPAALGVTSLLAHLVVLPWRPAVMATSTVCGLSFGWSTWEVARELSYAPIGHYGALPPEVRAMGDKSRWVIDWLSTKTTRDARVLFETSKARVHDRAHMAGYYALTADREFIGGPYPFMFFAGYHDGFAFGKSLESTPVKTFRRYLDVYNVGWIVAHSATSKRYLAFVPDVVPVDEHEGLQAYRVERPLSYFLVGSGRVESSGINRVALTDLQGFEAVIKYHYVAGLIADPPAKLEPYQIPGIPQPFVRITSITGPRVEIKLR